MEYAQAAIEYIAAFVCACAALRRLSLPQSHHLQIEDRLTGELKSKIEQITYLLFLRRLDDLHTLEENKANRLKKPMERRIFPEGNDTRGRAFETLRWSRFKNEAPSEMFVILGEHVFPFLRTLGSDDSTYAHHMKDARFTIPTPALLAKVVDLLDAVPMEDRAHAA